MAKDYSTERLLKIYEELELELIKKMTYHIKIMKLDGTSKSDIDRWQKSQESEIAKFKRESRNLIAKYQRVIDKETEKTLLDIYENSRKKEYKRLIRNYGKNENFKDRLSAININEVNGINDRRMAALLSAVKDDTSRAMTSVYRKINDEYRRIIHDAAIEFNTGNKTIYQAVDLAEKDFLKHGITSITYRNGAQVNIRSYSEMALRTNGQRAIAQGEATLRNQVGLHTVRVSSHGITCEKCAAWQGEILIDDVYQDGQPDGKYPLLSEAIAAGLLHPNCRHSLLSVDPEVDEKPPKVTYTAADKEKYEMQQKQRKLEREMRELKRYKAGATTPAAEAKYKKLIQAKSKQIDAFVEDNDYLIRQRERERI